MCPIGITDFVWILETVATIGFIAAAALQDEKGTHAVIGGVSTALMILPIFVVQW
jgi:hypothetical protein